MRRQMMWCLFTVVVCGGPYGISLGATPANGFVGKTLAMATFDELDSNLHTIPADIWQLRLKTQGRTDMYVQSNTWQPGGTTGWHTHPGPSLVVVTSGTITAYDSDDPTCTPHVYSAAPGSANNFIDVGGGHVHVVRNEDPTVVATAIAVQLIPEAATRRVDADAPRNCPANVK